MSPFLLKTKWKIMKLKIQFGEETHFDVANRKIFQTRAKLLQTMRLSLRKLAMAERPKPIKRWID